MPVAPRFNPEGVRVGSMPAPQVRPQTGMAEGLASAGETIAGLGRTVDRAQATQEQRSNAAEQVAREKQRAAETAAADLALEWKSRNEAKRSEFELRGIGSKVYDAYDSFTKGLEADTGEDLLADKSPEVSAEFNRRTSIYRRDIQAAANQYANGQNKAYTKVTAERELATSSASAAMAIAGGDKERYGLALGQAANAAQRLGESTGMPVDADALVGGVHYEGLRILLSEDPRKAVDFHRIYADKFGKFTDDAKRIVGVAQDSVRAQDVAEYAVWTSRQPNGLVDFSKAYEEAAKQPDMDDKRLEMANQRLAAAAAKQNQMRTQAGQDAISVATRAAQGTLAEKNAILSSAQYRQMRDIAQPEQQEAIRHAEQDIDNVVTVSVVNRMADYGTREEKDTFLRQAALGFPNYGISARTREAWNKKAEELRAGKEDPLRDRISSLYRTELRRNGKPVPVAYTGKPDSTEAKQSEEFMSFVDSVHMEIGQSKSIDWKDDNQIKSLIYRRMTTTVDRAEGGIFGGGVTKVPAINLYDPANPPSAETLAAAGVTDRDDWTAIGVKLEAYARRSVQPQQGPADAQPTTVVLDRIYRDEVTSFMQKLGSKRAARGASDNAVPMTEDEYYADKKRALADRLLP